MARKNAQTLQPVPVGSAERFFADNVVPRKPALFGSLSPDLAHLPELWTDEYLMSKAGAAELQVERRRGAGDAFGQGDASKVALTLAAALARMAAGDTSLYITTQPVPSAPDGHPELYASLVEQLAADVPLVPQLMGRLVPQSINLWLGTAPHGSSSGLHCDYHDNLYVLLRGRKRFRLYPPSLARRMYTVGRVARVHANGRIVFEGQGDILPDGSEAGDAAAWLARREAEAALAAAEAAAAQGVPGAARQLAAAEARLDAALDAALEGDDWAGADDFDALAEPAAAPPPAPAAAGDPESFSRVDLALPDDQLRRSFPRFPGKEAAVVCEVAAGQMLYLPAGWFHEVTSFSAPAYPTHAALNYWLHPPDNLQQGGAAALRRPYRSAYWPTVWEGRREEYEARHRRAEEGEGDGGLPAAGPQQQGDSAAAATAATAAGSKRRAAAAAEQREEEQQRAPRRRRCTRQAAAGGRQGQALPDSYGLFGVGRRQHLHCFVAAKP